MRREIGNRVVRWLVVAAMCALPVQGFAGNVGTTDIVDGAVTTPKIADGAVTAAKLGIVCPDGQYLKYTAGSGWACNVGTPGLQGPQGPVGAQGIKGDTGAQGQVGPMSHYANVVVVAKSGGDFTDPISALYSITDASETNRYLVKIMPGVYDITSIDACGSPCDLKGTINLREYVDIEGSGETNTIITSNPNLANYGVIRGASNCSLKKLKIVNSTGWNGYHSAYVVMLSDSRFNMSAPTENFEMSDVVIEIPNVASDHQVYGIVGGYPGPITFNNIKIKGAGGGGGAGFAVSAYSLKNSEIHSMGGKAINDSGNGNILVNNTIFGSILGDGLILVNNMINGQIETPGYKCIGNYDGGGNPITCP